MGAATVCGGRGEGRGGVVGAATEIIMQDEYNDGESTTLFILFKHSICSHASCGGGGRGRGEVE